MVEPKTERERFRAKGRTIVYGAFTFAVLIFVAVLLVEITHQAFAETYADDQGAQCSPGLQELMVAVERARAASCRTEMDEEQAVIAFRTALLPEWSRVGAIRRACEGDRNRLETLDAIQYLRYAEENTVRRESSELATLRRRARELLDRNVREASWPLQPPNR